MDLALKILTFGGPAILAIMGFVVVDRPPKSTCGKRVWYASFILVGIISVGAAVWDSERTDKAIRGLFTGGDSYCFYSAAIHDPANVAAKVPLWINCNGPLYNLATWFSPLEAKGDPNNPLYWSLRVGQHFAEIIPGGFMSSLELGAGSYRIEMSARNGTVIEILEIKNENGKLKQTLSVFRPGGEKLYSQ